jgi:hypothetical protein
VLQRAAAAFWASSLSGPKCGQGGFTRSAEGVKHRHQRAARLFHRGGDHGRPAAVKGTKTWTCGGFGNAVALSAKPVMSSV